MKDTKESPAERRRRIAALVPPTTDRETLGQYVRWVWMNWARDQPNAKPPWLVPWEELSEADKEVDRRIGETLARVGRGSDVRCSFGNRTDRQCPNAAVGRDDDIGAAMCPEHGGLWGGDVRAEKRAAKRAR
jgi:hypothetical protein